MKNLICELEVLDRGVLTGEELKTLIIIEKIFNVSTASYTTDLINHHVVPLNLRR